MASIQGLHAVDVLPAEQERAARWVATAFADTPAPAAAEPFFSFTYGGRAARELLPAWRREHTTRPLAAQRTEHVLTWTDPETGLTLRCAGIAYQDFPTVEWTLYVRNGGTRDTPILADLRAIDTRFERGAEGEFVLHQTAGDNCTPNSYAPQALVLPPQADLRIANRGGRPTQDAFPYFNLAAPGAGVIVVLSWAGQWSAQFSRDGGAGVQVRGGQELTHFSLHPGEEVRQPLVVLQFHAGDAGRAQNIWRRWMVAHNLPRPGGQLVAPMASLCTGNFYPNLMTEAVQERAFLQRHLDEGVAFDCWWQDAGWYPCDGVGWPKVGTWEVDPGRFPKGLRELSDLMHAKGRKTMVWFEPERVHPGTWIAENHPEWVYGGAAGGLLKLGEPACREWLTEHIDGLLNAQGIDYYRQDFNIDPLPFWRQNDPPDRQGITEIRHVEGYFAYWDELRRRHPGMLIDSCASGGRRNDLETLRRAVPLLRSDWYHGPEGQQDLTYGLSAWIPYHGTGVIYERDAYWFRSSYAAELSFGPDAAGLERVSFANLRQRVDEHRRIAPYFLGDFYPLTPYSPANEIWMAWQFDRPDLGAGVVQVFRRPASPYESARYPLQGLDPDASYAITDLDRPGELVLSGGELQEKGLPVHLPERPSAAIIVYRRAERPKP